MLDILIQNHLCNVVAIVTRYFGGILLGTGGLVKAYSSITLCAIKKAKLIEKEKGYLLKIIVEYTQLEAFKYYCRKNNIKVVKEEYLENVVFQIEITQQMYEKIKNEIDNFRLKIIKINKMEEKYI